MVKQEQLVEGMSQLVASINRLVDTMEANQGCQATDVDEDVDDVIDEDEAEAESADRGGVRGLVFLGREDDKCSGVLRVCDAAGNWVQIQRGAWTWVSVAIDGNGYWRWRCGNTNERSRGKVNYRQRVKRLRVLHKTINRDIVWQCYDVL